MGRGCCAPDDVRSAVSWLRVKSVMSESRLPSFANARSELGRPTTPNGVRVDPRDGTDRSPSDRVSPGSTWLLRPSDELRAAMSVSHRWTVEVLQRPCSESNLTSKVGSVRARRDGQCAQMRKPSLSRGETFSSPSCSPTVAERSHGRIVQVLAWWDPSYHSGTATQRMIVKFFKDATHGGALCICVLLKSPFSARRTRLGGLRDLTRKAAAAREYQQRDHHPVMSATGA